MGYVINPVRRTGITRPAEDRFPPGYATQDLADDSHDCRILFRAGKQFVSLLEPTDDIKPLEASLFAIMAAAAAFRMMEFISIYEAGRFHILINERIIIKLEYARSINPFRARHAGTA